LGAGGGIIQGLKVAGVSSFYRCKLFTPIYSNYVTGHVLNLWICLHSQFCILYIEVEWSGERSQAQQTSLENGAWMTEPIVCWGWPCFYFRNLTPAVTATRLQS